MLNKISRHNRSVGFGMVYTATMTENERYGHHVVLEGPKGRTAVVAMRGGSLEKLSFRYPKIDDPVDVVFPHESKDHLFENPTGAGGAFLAPIYNRVKGGKMHVVPPDPGELLCIYNLPLNFPRDEPRDSIHGCALKIDFEVVDISRNNDDKASVKLRFVTWKNCFGEFPQGVDYEVETALARDSLVETVNIKNHSNSVVPAIYVGRHTSLLPGYVEGSRVASIDNLMFQIESPRILDIDQDKNVTGGVIDVSAAEGTPMDNLNFTKLTELGLKDVDNTYIMAGGKTAKVWNPEHKVGVVTECGNNVEHLTVWTNGEKRRFAAFEPGNHAGACNSEYTARNLGQRVLYPGESATLSGRSAPFRFEKAGKT
jgi:galactose mutarotase-like enzyme